MKKITGIKAISFDADGTLWDFQNVMRRSLGLTLRELEAFDPIAANRIDVDTMIRVFEQTSEEMKAPATRWEQIRLEATRRTLMLVGRTNDVLAAHLSQFYLKHRYEDIEPFDDALPTLEALKKKYVIGCVSNGNSYPDRCGLAGVFDFVVFSQDYGVEKPDPRLYLIAAEKAGFAVLEMLHVGDSLTNDVAGASRAGIRAVWLNRQRENANPAIKADYEVSSLAELLDIL